MATLQRAEVIKLINNRFGMSNNLSLDVFDEEATLINEYQALVTDHPSHYSEEIDGDVSKHLLNLIQDFRKKIADKKKSIESREALLEEEYRADIRNHVLPERDPASIRNAYCGG